LALPADQVHHFEPWTHKRQRNPARASQTLSRNLFRATGRASFRFHTAQPAASINSARFKRVARPRKKKPHDGKRSRQALYENHISRLFARARPGCKQPDRRIHSDRGSMQALFIGHTYIDVTFLTDRLPVGDEKHVASGYAIAFVALVA
jgi:hypothetical protein